MNSKNDKRSTFNNSHVHLQQIDDPSTEAVIFHFDELRKNKMPPKRLSVCYLTLCFFVYARKFLNRGPSVLARAQQAARTSRVSTNETVLFYNLKRQ